MNLTAGSEFYVFSTLISGDRTVLRIHVNTLGMYYMINCTFLRELGEACRARSQNLKPHTRFHLSWPKTAENNFGFPVSLEKFHSSTSGPVKGLILC